MNRKIKLIIAVLIFVIGAGLIWWKTTPTSSSNRPSAMRQAIAQDGTPVLTATAKSEPMSIYLSGIGSVVPSSLVTVTSRVEGQLVKLYFSEGQMVQKGQLLAQIDSRAFQASLTQAQGQLAKSQAALVNAKQDLARFQMLAKQDSIAKQQLDSQAALVRQYQGEIKSNEGSIASAKLQLEYSRITAPISGRVGLRKVDVGNIVQANSVNGLVDIAQMTPIDVIFSLPQSQLGTLLSRMQLDGEKPKVEVWDQGMKKQLGEGTVVTVDNQMDPVTGTIKIKAQFDNQNLALFPNQFVNVRMYVEQMDNAITVPIQAVQNGSIGDYVWVVGKGNKASAKPIVKGFTDGQKVVVSSGLKAGENVIIDGVERLKEGGLVAPVDPNANVNAPKAKTEKNKPV